MNEQGYRGRDRCLARVYDGPELRQGVAGPHDVHEGRRHCRAAPAMTDFVRRVVEVGSQGSGMSELRRTHAGPTHRVTTATLAAMARSANNASISTVIADDSPASKTLGPQTIARSERSLAVRGLDRRATNALSLRSGRNPVGAGDGNRTRMASLEGWSSTIELHPRAPWSRISLEHEI